VESEVNPYIDPLPLRLPRAPLDPAEWRHGRETETRAVVEEVEMFCSHVLTDEEVVRAKDPEAMLRYIKEHLTVVIAKELAERLEWQISTMPQMGASEFRCRFTMVRVISYIHDDERK